MTVQTDRLTIIDTIHLDDGGHESFDDGVCLEELCAYLAGEDHTAEPVCVSPILGVFGRSLNDALPDDKRQRLVALAVPQIGTAGDGLDQVRGLMAADWLIRVSTPTWLRLARLENSAVSLETLPRQATWDDVDAAVPVVREARKQAHAAWAAVAAGAAARTTAAAAEAAGAAAGAAGAAGDAALQPTVALLQESAIDLFTRMIQPEVTA